MPRWAIPMKLVEYGREAIIEADTKADALRIFRTRGWDECTNASSFKVTQVGACVRLDEDEEKPDAK